MNPGLPTIVIGGYLGAGKTTLVNHLLRQAQGRRMAVLVNDFGAINIDADLIEGQHGDVLTLSGGCICCSFGADLVGTLGSITQREQPPDVVLIETSGVALPGLVARSARLAPGIELQGVAVVADAETLQARAGDRYVGDVVMQQLRDADLLLLNKTDLVEGHSVDGLHDWLAGMRLKTAVVSVTQGRIAPELLLGIQHHAGSGTPLRLQAADERFVSLSIELPAGTDPQALAERLAQPGQGILRAKAWGRDAQGQGWLLQRVGPRWSLTPLALKAEASATAWLVMIGLRGVLAPNQAPQPPPY